MFINLTPHVVVVIAKNGNKIVVEPSGTIARVDSKQVVTGEVDGIPVVNTIFGDVTGIPEPKTGTIYLVSSLVAQAARREDVLAPDTGTTAVRENGQIVAVTRLQTFSS